MKAERVFREMRKKKKKGELKMGALVVVQGRGVSRELKSSEHV